jgi:hypothetical protein
LIGAIESITRSLHALASAGTIDGPSYRNDMARWLRLKADLLRLLGHDGEAQVCERAIIAQFSAPEWAGAPTQVRATDPEAAP